MDLRKYVKWTIKALAPANQRGVDGPRRSHFLEVSKVYSKFPALKEPKKLAKVDYADVMSIKEGDLVRVLYGKDAGSHGVVKAINRETNQVIVDNCNLSTTPYWNNQAGALVEEPIHVKNVAIVDPVLKKPTRLKTRCDMNGQLVRISKISRCAMPEPVGVVAARPGPMTRITETVNSKSTLFDAISRRLKEIAIV